ncbi:sensor domain-containing diguanylate cyclase [Ectopseudomonas alcaliphila]|uniref:Diguanylate cyclase n=1 Tax=Ectopseudomonas alcaliphila TaxID=101564 RepID=A0A1G6U1F8_9GAMM|nr:sensor domain-containing diguanylate cyclase [Pseudomonas alcaliphila]MDX5991429.1 diguanylate cyclase [Pseudomonas alcaliphila]SDD35024.1 PAS domain S-box-containing protein/diguanylate cyclase (GGDEF) domain-containing protein [Pseudomonas alcaliphila]
MQPLYSVNVPNSANDEQLDGVVRLVSRYFDSAAVLVSGTGSARHIWASPGLSETRLTRIIGISETTPNTLVWPLQAQADTPLGTLYLHFDQPHQLDAKQREALQDFAALALDLLVRAADEARQRHEIAALRDSERRMALAISGSGTGIWDRNVATGEIHYSSSWKALLGYAEHEIGNRIEESYTRVHPADLDYVRATIQAHLDQRTEAYEVEHRLRCRDGQYKWVCSRGKVVERDKHGKPLRMVGTTTDITAMRRLSEQVQLTATLMTDLTNEIPGMVFQYRRQADGTSAFTYVSAGAQAICGLSAMQLMQDAQALTDIVHPDDRKAFIDSFQLSAEQLTPWHLEFRVQVPGREIAWCQGEACPRREEDGSVIWHGFMTDLTERKQIEAELQAFATTDFLTQLANRRHFMCQLEAELARLQRSPEQSAAILMFDLDYFKTINDRWGHNVGDQALRHFAGILSSQLRKTDTAGRLGGEEFAVVLSEANLDKARNFATRIQNELARSPILHAGEPIFLAVSVGISSLNASDASVEAALSRSDIALYCAKRGGRNRIEYH